MNKINKQNRKRLMDTENRLTAVKGEGVGGHGEKGKGIKHTQTTHRARQHIVTTREKEGWEEAEHDKAGINSSGRRLDLGW